MFIKSMPRGFRFTMKVRVISQAKKGESHNESN